ncbi:hypothetical protein M9H77_03677 [Catharanthus roseus]|uniref:Uncharacterized protein n=1 Tax=Catharanthus roseus TaxID=4058 RepID=A0ACC0CC31_CATRO|nr:hypothetical protein M9H77_03677 [Catharanthus roseus]
MVKIVLKFVMDSSNNERLSNGHNNSLNVMVAASSNTESGMATYLDELAPLTSPFEHIEEEANLLSPDQRVSTISTELPPSIVVPQGPPPSSGNIARDHRHFSIRDYVASNRPTELQGLNGRSSELIIAAYVFGLPVPMVRSNTSEQSDDGSLSRNVDNQSLTGLNNQQASVPTTLVSIDNVNQGQGGSSSSSQSDVNMRDPRLISQSSNQLPSVNVLTSIDTSHERTIRPSSIHGGLDGPTVVNNVQNNNSEHDGMRMDIDNLSYEDLLALGENIGNVSTALNEETIRNRLKRGKYRVNKYVGTPEKQKVCCICLDEFVNRQELGKLDCRHNYHVTCIEKWLMEKNCCPLCKRTAISE